MEFSTLLHTLRHLRFSQAYHQLKYRLAPAKTSPFRPETIVLELPKDLSEPGIVLSPVSEAAANSFEAAATEGAPAAAAATFTFIGKTAQFGRSIDWNYGDYGKLWTYNLNYFEFLLSPRCSKQQGLKLLQGYIDGFASLKDGLEPYPTSLRIINWIKFMAWQRPLAIEQALLKAISWQLDNLAGRLEYHLMGNHLLENGFALFIGGCRLRQVRHYKLGEYIVLRELEKQTLSDGGHFEQSPMYHHIILHRLLDAINLMKYSQFKGQQQVEKQLRAYAARMLGWMQEMTFSDNSFPCFNDATPGIAPDPDQLEAYARELGVAPREIPLGESGYRMWRKQGAEFCFDIGNVTASYQPGHTHADTFSCCLHVNALPVIVDTGISTYEKNERRHLERSTAMHNTLTIDDLNSTAVWDGFRVGRRARVRVQEEAAYRLSAAHDGYKDKGGLHRRTFDWQREALLIEDALTGKTGKRIVASRLHFHPDRKVRLEGNKIFVDDLVMIAARGYETVFVETYAYCQGYNDQRPAIRVVGHFRANAAWKVIFLTRPSGNL